VNHERQCLEHEIAVAVAAAIAAQLEPQEIAAALRDRANLLDAEAAARRQAARRRFADRAA
jgi:hypothetical protein